jgi:Ni/Fe-hydrogenase b-type cytochrome subunit
MHPARLEHTAVVRLCHWTVVVVVTILVASGLEIFAAFPSFGDKIPQRDLFVPPDAVRLGGWLGGALQWHLSFAWLFLATGAAYVAFEIASGNYRQVAFAPSDVRGVWPMVHHYFFSGPKPPGSGTYNPLQKLACTTALVLAALLAVTGLALYKPVQLSWLVATFGGFRLTRVWHFLAMTSLLCFIPGHVVMVALHGWANFAAMWTRMRPGVDPVCPGNPTSASE